MDPREMSGSLASGGSFRASPALLEILSPDGETVATFDPRFFVSVTRNGQTITITRQANSTINVTTASLADAEQLEALLRPQISGPQPTAAVDGDGDKSFNSVLKWGCIGTLSVVGILAVCLIIALVLLRDNDDAVRAGSPIATPTPAGTGPAATSSLSSSTPDATSPADGMSDPAPTPTNTPAPEPTATPEPGLPGSARDNPVPFGETGGTDNWELQVLEVVRGQEAYDILLEVNQFNSPPPAGHEYVLVNLRARYTGDDDQVQDVDGFWLQSTGAVGILHAYTFLVERSPEFRGSIFSGAEVTGWATLLALEGDDNLLLIFQPWLNWDDEDRVFLALEEGARIDSARGRVAEENDLGLSRSDPVPFGEHSVGEIWELWVIETIRGEQAREIVLEASQFNDEPDGGMEYLLAHIGARNAGEGDEAQQINELLFRVTGDANVVYDTPYAVDPDPRLDYYVYPGGEISGWITMLVPSDETNLRLIYEPWFSFTDVPRYFALE